MKEERMRHRWHHHRHHHAKIERREREHPAVDSRVFAKLGVTSEKIGEIESAMLGTIILPGMSEYPEFSKGHGLSVWDQGEPLAIFRCLDAWDVWTALEATWQHNWEFVCRSGGHSTAGYSSNAETVIDLTGLDSIALLDGGRVSVEPGVTLGKLNRFMKLHRLHIPTGNCDDVRVGGYVQGGGYGYTSRQFGMQCDTLVEATVMLGDGRTVRASAQENPDLFWAIRGGTGNNFGIVLSFVFQTVPLEEIWGFVYVWKGDAAPRAMLRAQDAYGLETGLEIGFTGNITTVKEGDAHIPVYMMSGVCVDGREAGRAALAPMFEIGGHEEMLDRTGFWYEINDAVESLLPGIPEAPAGAYEIKSSAYIARPMPLEAWCELWRLFVDGIQATNPYNLLVLEAYGGAIDRFAPDDMAFMHRNVLMDVYVDAFWSPEGELRSFEAAQAWIEEIDRFLSKHSNGHWYQNYPQRDMPDYRWRYWGDNFPSLLFVKQKFDPLGRFRFEQAVTPYPDDPTLIRSTAASRWTERGIAATAATPRFVAD
jgi:FAD/FMN-containing dehydrogenase